MEEPVRCRERLGGLLRSIVYEARNTITAPSFRILAPNVIFRAGVQACRQNDYLEKGNASFVAIIDSVLAE